MELTFRQIERTWNSSPLLERLFFLMGRLRMTEDDGMEVAKLEFKKIRDSHKVAIYNELNKENE